MKCRIACSNVWFIVDELSGVMSDEHRNSDDVFCGKDKFLERAIPISVLGLDK